jgi:hypothetical protein
MWQTRSVFQADAGHVISTARRRRKLGWRSICQRRVGTMVVIVLTPQSQLVASIGQGEEDFHVQALIAQLPLKLSM